MSARKPTICLDFDGVVHSYTSGWQGPRTIPDPPVDGAVEWIYAALNSGYRVAIFSSRSAYFLGRAAMRSWLRKHTGRLWENPPSRLSELSPLGIESVEFPRHKPAVLISIDDRAFHFEGRFPDLALLRTFKPWNKRSEDDEFVVVVDDQGKAGEIQNPPLRFSCFPGTKVIDLVDPKVRGEAARYLQEALDEETIAMFRSWIASDPDEWHISQVPRWHFRGGMAIRNLLREGGFDEERLKVMNLDDVYADLVRDAVEEPRR